MHKRTISLCSLLIPAGHGWVGSAMGRQPACFQLNAVAVTQHTTATSSQIKTPLKSTTIS